MKSRLPLNISEQRTAKKVWMTLSAFLLCDTLNSLILIRKKKRIYDFDKNKFAGINLASSVETPENWIGVSGGISIFFLSLPEIIQRFASLFLGGTKKIKAKIFIEKYRNLKIIHHDLLFGIPFKNNAVPYIFSSHFLEHVTYPSASFLAEECYRVLEPGGIVRIVVPSLDGIVADLRSALQRYSETRSPEALLSFLTTKNSDFIDRYSHHRYIYNFEKLHELFARSGFTRIREWVKGEGTLPDLASLETRDGLIIEAQKPG